MTDPGHILGAAPQLRVAIADDHGGVRGRLATLVVRDPDLELVGEAETVADTCRLVTGERPDVLVLDRRLRRENSIDAIPAVRRACPQIAVVMVSSDHDEAFAEGALRAGASAYLVKEHAGRTLVRALRAAAGGLTYLDLHLVGAGGRTV